MEHGEEASVPASGHVFNIFPTPTQLFNTPNDVLEVPFEILTLIGPALDKFAYVDGHESVSTNSANFSEYAGRHIDKMGTAKLVEFAQTRDEFDQHSPQKRAAHTRLIHQRLADLQAVTSTSGMLGNHGPGDHPRNPVYGLFSPPQRPSTIRSPRFKLSEFAQGCITLALASYLLHNFVGNVVQEAQETFHQLGVVVFFEWADES
jgi:hypothetical protein